MKSELPKVLHPLKGRPLILHVLDSLKGAGVKDLIVIVGYRGEDVIQSLDGIAAVAWQHQQLGTGHAVMQAEKQLEGFSGSVIVACGDVPLIKAETFESLIEASKEQGVKAAVLTMNLDDPTGYGRIVKNEKGDFVKIVEEKDASAREKDIKEVNTGTYVFDKEFLFKGLARLDRNNAQGEYYLTDALQYVLSSGFRVKPVLLADSIEGRGVNSKEELMHLEQHLDEVRG